MSARSKAVVTLLTSWLAVTLVGGSRLWAQDLVPGPDSMPTFGTKGETKGHTGSSPWDPDPASDTTFVADTGGSLDQETWRSDGPIVFSIPVTRVVGEDLAILKKSGALGAEAILQMPAWDVDYDYDEPPVQPERDEVYFNDHLISDRPGNSRYLIGANQIWAMNTFRIPVEWINFPADPEVGGTVQPADNTIAIYVDTENSGDDEWVTAIDWAELRIEAAPPIVFAHGIRSSGGVWDSMRQWVQANLGIPTRAFSFSAGIKALGSIQDNASQLGQEITAAKRRWGVDKVNIVSHSKGGLDSRHYVESHADVNALIQIATPNQGAPLADEIQAALIWKTGWTALGLEGLLAPAGYQLSVTYMTLYNWGHGLNPNCTYRTLAGHCENPIFEPWTGPVWALTAATYGHYAIWPFTQKGDSIVPVWSVHALGTQYDFSPWTTSGTRTEALHTKIAQQEDVFKLISNDLVSKVSTSPTKGGGQACRRVGGTKGGSPLLPGNITQGYADTVTQGENKAFPVTISDTGQVGFLLYYTDGNLDLALVDPHGTRWTNSSPADGVTYSVSEDTQGFKFETYGIASAAKGTWTAEVNAVSVSTTQAFFLAAYEIESPISLQLDLGKSFVVKGQDLTLHGTLENGSNPVTGAQVAAKVLRPDGSTMDLNMADDGNGPDAAANDGVYSVLIPTTVAGHYKVSVTATSSAPSFSRQAMIVGSASESSSEFAGPSNDSGLDQNGNGLFDVLRVNLGVNVQAQATYLVFGQLTDGSGQVLAESSVTTNLAPGIASVPLDFSGSMINQSRVNGPYTIGYASIAEETVSGDVLPVVEGNNLYQTQNYNYDQFEHDPIGLAGGGSDQGVDTDSDGKFDVLRVGVDLDLDSGYAGNYNWSASLADTNGGYITLASGSGYLAAKTKGGTAELVLDFPGEDIGGHGSAGPYVVQDLLIWGSASKVAWFKTPYVTGPYSASQFKGGGGAVIVDVTPDVTTTFNSWTLDRSTGAMIASITIRNDAGKDGVPLEKVFWYAIQEGANIRLANPSGQTNGLAYVDVTAQVEAQLPGIGNGDMKLDVGESVTFTAAIYTRDRTIPTGHIFGIWADPPIVPERYHAYDANTDNVIDDFEALEAVDGWNRGMVDDFGLLEAIELWRAGGYEWDEAEGKFVPRY